MDNEKIIRKVKRLLALAKENKSDEEGQSAFMLAQRLMLENDIDAAEIGDNEDVSDFITENNVTIYKRLFWWEKRLARIIADNFRVKMFYDMKEDSGEITKSAITFYGLDKDLVLAKEMYLLAYEALLFHSKFYVNSYYENSEEKRSRYLTESLKSSYIRGFLKGIERKFEEQISVLRNEFEILVLTPQIVIDAYKIRSEGFTKHKFKIPAVKEDGAYDNGYKKGNSIDFTKSMISENVES
ncbi:TPA: DUF2786 domain-containing protein [Listeria monocytogenes]|uniref:DUF2786 domain-containing protein n=3 Tax=Listeria monocytogenes TaxID=1639 RepID=A0A823KSF3_LISMN|nr:MULTISPECIES: DUF2786 domain-containing protein [Listeria]EAA0320690.1 DUF2786 domain-containing protein [Listeria monocytogenes]EAC2545585.1 DUF2786 domain-containing protein [Listeria monocytogenes]EAC3663586.1 DUF2786 domain-containing protein [Listeria monocytogenes]EAC5067785.1 DUF2786 domain-containing protein [Listeria monocytogenes]EAC6774130.1 DUF2786 domain-containing protein [Listeria monocytogenes]